VTGTAHRLRRRLVGERGFTLVELMVAATVAAIGVGAVTTILIGSRELVGDSERGDAASYVAQKEMERALAVPYDKVALKQAPGTSANSADPRFYVASSGGGWTYKWDQASGSSAAAARVLVDTTNGGLDASTAWSDGRMSGVVYRFVTVYDDPAVPNDTSNAVLPDGDGKRITIVATVTGGRRPRKPVIQTAEVLP